MSDREKRVMSGQSYRSAGTLLAQLVLGKATPVALVNHYSSRTAQFNKLLNAVVQQYYALALGAVARADRERLEGCARGVLHGLPYTAEESSNTQGQLITSGAHYLKDNRTTQNAPSIARLRAAGAILTRKTNVPMVTTDWQTYNDLCGTTHNLQDRQRSPDGPPGGAAVAVAADSAPVEFGSDLFDLLCTPARYTDVYAHRYSLGLVSVRGHVSDGSLRATDEPGLSAADPMARSTVNLCLMMRALSMFWVEPPRIPGFSHYQAEANYHMCTWFSAPHHEIDQQIARRFQSPIDKLRAQSDMEVDDTMPADINPDTLFDIVVKPSDQLISAALNGHQRLTAGLAMLGLRLAGRLADMPEGITSYHQSMLKDSGEQQNTDKLRHGCSRIIETLLACHDVLLMPISPVLTFTRMQRPVRKHKFIVNGEPQDYSEHSFWNTLATAFGLPVTVYPLAKTVDEPPCDIQITSEHFHDDVTISFAEFREGISGGLMVSERYWRRMSVTAPIEVRRI